ncbi:glycosyltransferase family 2 protein [Pseudocolwellia sp. HL-MZ7]|uniref:glycosyltransferase family 2 protein n=1 Tax=Pseudocolwellia sp. HL-MZ7 TaxID=3400627 RepID=UPI003CF7155C
MKVSIITATYNSASTILDTIKSIESQSYESIEYIIVDGNSSDDTIELIQKNCTKVSTFIIEKDKGIYDALNKGLAVATGDIVGFLHSDDLFASENSISNLVSAFENDSDAIYADLEYVQKSDTNKVVRLWKSGVFNISKINNGWMPPHPTFYMRTSLYKKYGSFNLDYKIAADYDSLLRYLWVNKVQVSYLPEVLIKMRVGGASNRSLKNIYQKSLEDIKALKSNKVPVFKAFIIKNISKIPQFIFK